MIIVTGGLGFIGSNIVHMLNQQGYENIIVVDDFTDGTKFTNISDAHIADYMEKEEFLKKITSNPKLFDSVKALIHQGACSTTTEWDGKFMMANNYRYSKELLDYCREQCIPFLYASSAAIYGGGKHFVEEPQYERPLNVYGYSKSLFDQYVRRLLPSIASQVAGFRYFNVYGPREQHKGTMASVAFHLHKQLKAGNEICLFEGSDGYGNGEQRRDFVFVEDVVDVLFWFMEHPDRSGIFNVGTGKSQSFNDVAQAVLKAHGRGTLRYIPFPDHLKGRYQSFTEANISLLRQTGYTKLFRPVEVGVPLYIQWLQQNQH